MANDTEPTGSTDQQPPQQNAGMRKSKTDLVDNVINRVNFLVENGGFILPNDYNVSSAVRAAYFMIGEVVDRDKKPALDVCTEASVSEAIFRMTMQGLDPVKLQCYFIVNGNKLSLRRSYMGAIVVAKRVADLEDIAPRVIRQGDVFTYKLVNGFITDVVHESLFENIDNDIIGAYAVASFKTKGAEPFIDLMSMKQIKESWKMSINQSNNKLQTNFGEEACKRTIIARTLKPKINASTDANMYMKDLTEDNEVEDADHEVVTSKPTAETKQVALPPAQERQTVPEKQTQEAQRVEMKATTARPRAQAAAATSPTPQPDQGLDPDLDPDDPNNWSH